MAAKKKSKKVKPVTPSAAPRGFSSGGVGGNGPRPGDQSLDRPHPNRIRELRLKGVPLSQERLGVLIGSDKSTVSRDESGDQPMSKDRIVAYASIFGISTYELFMEPSADLPVSSPVFEGGTT